MTEIIPGIHQLQIPIPDNPLGYTNSYLVQGDNECLLIDLGMNTDEAFDSLKAGLSAIRVGCSHCAKFWRVFAVLILPSREPCAPYVFVGS